MGHRPSVPEAGVHAETSFKRLEPISPDPKTGEIPKSPDPQTGEKPEQNKPAEDNEDKAVNDDEPVSPDPKTGEKPKSPDPQTGKKPERTKLAVFVDMQWASKRQTSICVISDQADVTKVYDDILLNLWGLERPKLILTLNGGAEFMNPEDKNSVHFCESLVRAAKHAEAWVLTGATNSGYMQLVGKAMQKHDLNGIVACIGVGPFGALKKHWREQLDKKPADPDDPVIQEPVEPQEVEDLDKDLTTVEPNHTNCVLIDSGKTGMAAFGSEVEWRERLETYIAKQGIRRVMILVNGGANALAAIYLAAVTNTCPTVVCNGSGRAANFIASAIEEKTDWESPKMDESKALEKWNKHMNHGVEEGKKVKVDGVVKKLEQEKLSFIEIVRRLIRCRCLKIFGEKDRLEDVLLMACYNSKETLVDGEGRKQSVELAAQWRKQSVELAVQWQCSPKCYESTGAKELLEDGNEGVTWILNRFVDEWQLFPAEHLMNWLLANYREKFRHLNQDEFPLKSIPDQWTDCALVRLYFWLVENGAHSSVVDVVWQELEDPAHAALLAAHVYRKNAQEREASDSFGDTDKRQRFQDMAKRSENLAIRMLNQLFSRCSSVRPEQYLFRRSKFYPPHDLIALAHLLECKEFVSQQFYNTAVDLVWANSTPTAIFFHRKDRQRIQRTHSEKQELRRSQLKASIHTCGLIFTTVCSAGVCCATQHKVLQAVSSFLVLMGACLMQVGYVQRRATIVFWEDSSLALGHSGLFFILSPFLLVVLAGVSSMGIHPFTWVIAEMSTYVPLGVPYVLNIVLALCVLMCHHLYWRHLAQSYWEDRKSKDKFDDDWCRPVLNFLDRIPYAVPFGHAGAALAMYLLTWPSPEEPDEKLFGVMLYIGFWRLQRIYKFWNVHGVAPRFKAITHLFWRSVFTVIYSGIVLLNSTDQGLICLLLVWGLGLAYLEVRQFRKKSCVWEYLSLWNIFDVLTITLLVISSCITLVVQSSKDIPFPQQQPDNFTITMGFNTTGHDTTTQAPPQQWDDFIGEVPRLLNSVNLLFCYLRLLQLFELSENSGTLLSVVSSLVVDSSKHFLGLLSIISIGFSCSLTALQQEETGLTAPQQENKGILQAWADEPHTTWQKVKAVLSGYWAIFGDVDELTIRNERSMPWLRSLCFGFLRYLMFLSSNVVLVNLFIAMLTDAWTTIKSDSKREWAFRRVDTVLEYSRVELAMPILPPPVDTVLQIMEWAHTLLDDFFRHKGLATCMISKAEPLSEEEVAITVHLSDQDVAEEDLKKSKLVELGGKEHDPRQDSRTKADVVIEPDKPKGGLIYFTGVPLDKPLAFIYGDRTHNPVKIEWKDVSTKDLSKSQHRQIANLQRTVLDDWKKESKKAESKEANACEADSKEGQGS